MRRLVPLLGLLVCWGCTGPSLEGTWNVTPGEPVGLPVQPTIQATFVKDGTGTAVFRAESDVPGLGNMSLEADVTGTWKMEGDKLTWTPQVATFKPVNGKELPAFITDGVKPELTSNIGKNASGKVKWDGSDKFTVTTDEGKTATFERVKSG